MLAERACDLAAPKRERGEGDARDDHEPCVEPESAPRVTADKSGVCRGCLQLPRKEVWWFSTETMSRVGN